MTSCILNGGQTRRFERVGKIVGTTEHIAAIGLTFNWNGGQTRRFEKIGKIVGTTEHIVENGLTFTCSFAIYIP